MNKVIIKDLEIKSENGSGIIDTFESEGVLYSGCKIVKATVLIRLNSAPFRCCYFEDCDIRTESGSIIGLGGQNYLANSTVNGELRDALWTH